MFSRIISLTPSITETLFALGAGDRVVGVTDSCDYPQKVNEISHVCSWFDPDVERIRQLKPDLVIGLETVHEQMQETFKSSGIKLVLLNSVFMTDVFTDILDLGIILDLHYPAQAIVDNLFERLAKLAKRVRQIPRKNLLTVSRVLDVENGNLIVAGPKSFQFDVIKCAGGINVTGRMNEAYPKISFKQFAKWDPQMIFFCGSDSRWLENIKCDPLWKILRSVQKGRVYQFDCSLTCRTGPRIMDMAELLYKTLYT